MQKHWHVIINPHTLNIRKERLWMEVKAKLTALEFILEQHITESGEACKNSVSELLDKQFRHFIIVGGDGTLNEVVNAVMKHSSAPGEVTLALIPAGTGNDWSRTHKIPHHSDGLVGMFTRGRRISHDVGFIETRHEGMTSGRYFINIAGFGFDAEVIIRINKSVRLRYAGKMMYLKNLFLTLLFNKPNPCLFEIDGEKLSLTVFSGVAGICHYNGGGMMQVPMALYDDGLFDLVLIEPMNLWEVLTQLPRLYKGTHIAYRKVHHYRAAQIIIKPQQPMFAETEGEIAGTGPFVIKKAQSSIGVLIP